MFSLYQKYWRTAFDIGVIVLTVWLVMFVFSYLYKIATPVFLSFLVFLCIEPLAKRLHKLGMRKAIASGISVLLFTLIVLGVFAGLGFIFYSQTAELVKRLPQYQEQIKDQVPLLMERLYAQMDKLPDGVEEKLRNAVDFVAGLGTRWATSLFNWLIGFLSSLSSFIVSFSIAIILAYFLSVEIDMWRRLASDRSPKTFKAAFAFLRENVFRGIGAYFKAQAKLVSVTFLVIFIALLALQVNNAFAIALLAGFFDVLPLLGVSTVFIPWILYLFIVGQTGLALWLTALLVAVTLTRQFLEPRITGQTVGVSAFTMLAFMMISLSFFGVAGLILAPILMILLKALYDQGYFHRWIRWPASEFTVSPLAPQQAEGAVPVGDESPDRSPDGR
ncbi:AI-2E family transporter [Cohnella nanjingensis]|uniref:AI-2E family transporter n=1 Tax=Cohnella nanjingensis TaxID=1387779 RepID=A0A7X0RUM6_9BACL|nr:AI-2E family transporter [Cohnella nanjingensis]MBB6673910.1 AI-2E family transporter [Cohnella nanjingensis]